MKVILYTRVSTDKQAEQGLGLQVQEKALRAWARNGSHKVVGLYTDSGISGSNGLDTRPGLAAAFADTQAGKAAALVVYRLDRLSRKLADQETWIEQLERAGRKVISITEPEYGEDEMRALVRQILGAVAQYERAVIRKRLANGRAEKHAQGGYAYGGPPYGWAAVGKELVPVEDEQQVLVVMRQLRATGMSYAAVASALNDAGHVARRGGWHAQTVSRALARTSEKQ